MKRIHDFQWLAKLAYLADVLSTPNKFDLALQRRAVTIFNFQDKTKTARLKMELQCACINRQEFKSFPKLTDLLLTVEEELDGDTVAAFEVYLQGLRSQ